MSCKMDQTTPICYLYLYFPSHYNIIFTKSQAIWAKKFLKKKRTWQKNVKNLGAAARIEVKLPRSEKIWGDSLTKYFIKKPYFSTIWVPGHNFEARRKFNRSKSLIILYNYRFAYDYFLVNSLWNSLSNWRKNHAEKRRFRTYCVLFNLL